MAALEHITPEQIAQYGVIAAPDRLTGRADDNKKIFDRLVRELVAVVVNEIIDKTNELLVAESVREENEKNRVAAELLRVEAENLRVQAENQRVTNEGERVQAEAARVAAETLRVQAENLRVSAEQSRVDAEQERERAEAERESTTRGIVAQATAQAKLSESWAVGGTGVRPGEDTNNAKYWAAIAQIAAGGDKVVYVDTFGAVGDGVTDDTEAIQKAIDFVQDRKILSLSFTPGRSYKISGTLSIEKEIFIHGNGAKLLSYVESGPFLVVSGTIEAENILSANVIATHGDESKVLVSTVLPHGFSTGDRIVIQSQRDALSEDSGDYWCGTPTANSKTCQYAEVLVVQKALSDTDIECTGSLVYPYYFADREPGVDTSTQPDQREHSTVRKANFVTGLVVENLTIECYGQGKTHTDNTMILRLCEDAVVENVRIVTHGGHGRLFAFDNCLNCAFVRCVSDASETVYESYMDSHAIDNHFTFASSWACVADGCATYHAGQSFDATYTSPDSSLDRVRCPSLFPSVRNCLVHGPVDSAATNHSGCFGCTYESCKFINFARALAVRSPATIVHGCMFTANRSGSERLDEDFAISISDPTTFGTRITNCVISADSGIRISPGLSLLDTAPTRKRKGIVIEGNTFFAVKARLIYIGPSNSEWNYVDGNSSNAYSQYAKDPIDVTIRDNLFLRCGDDRTTAIGIYCSALNNGVVIDRNRFVSCKSKNEFIGHAVPNTDFQITNNIFSDCSAPNAYNYAYALSKSDPRNEALDENYMTRNVYARNTSTDRDFLVCNSVKGNVNLFRNNATRCGSLYSNLDSTKDGYIGWYGDLRKGNEAMTFVVAGDDSYKMDAAALYPVTDDANSIGSANNRWKDIYVVNSPISTSDEGEKQDISDIPDEVLEAWGKVRCKLFRFRQAVNEKGESARNHIGLIAQDIQRAFTDAGLDAADYGLFCADVVPDGNGGEKTVLGVRYAEALALECAYIRHRLDLAGM